MKTQPILVMALFKAYVHFTHSVFCSSKFVFRIVKAREMEFLIILFCCGLLIAISSGGDLMRFLSQKLFP